MILASRGNPLAGAISSASRDNRAGMGLGAGPILPPGVGLPGTGMPRANLTGASESTGNPVASIAALMSAASGMGGSRGGGPKASRGIEKPSLSRSSAISRRLNGNPSRGTELKGL